MTGCLCSWVTIVLSAAAVATLIGLGLQRARGAARPRAARAAAACEGCREQLAAAERENARLRERVQTLEDQVRTVVGRG